MKPRRMSMTERRTNVLVDAHHRSVTPRLLAATYSVSERTALRDLRWLEQLGMVREWATGWRAVSAR